eukprot:COSAG01_NODE_5332_length_4329_cov_4505.447991_4_plen_113_part_00
MPFLKGGNGSGGRGASAASSCMAVAHINTTCMVTRVRVVHHRVNSNTGISWSSAMSSNDFSSDTPICHPRAAQCSYSEYSILCDYECVSYMSAHTWLQGASRHDNTRHRGDT